MLMHSIFLRLFSLCFLLGTATFAAASQSGFSDPGPYYAGFRTVTVTRPNATTFTARLFYPAFASGQDTLFDASGCPCPAITFGHGFFQTVSTYQSTLEHLATHGYLVIASNSESGLFPNHQNFANDLRHSLTFLEQQNANSSSILFGAVAVNKFGASGHSMGGGASILATSQDTRIKALSNLAAAETNPSAKAAMPLINVPYSLLSGSADTIVPVATNGQEMFAAGKPPKVLPIIQGGWHCGFQDSNGFGCDSGTIGREQQLTETRRLLTSFFDLYLKRDTTAIDSIWGDELDNPFVISQRNSAIVVTPEIQSVEIPLGDYIRAPIIVKNLMSTNQAFKVEAFRQPPTLRVKTVYTPFIKPGGEYTAMLPIRREAYDPRVFENVVVAVTRTSDPLTASFVRISLNQKVQPL